MASTSLSLYYRYIRCIRHTYIYTVHVFCLACLFAVTLNGPRLRRFRRTTMTTTTTTTTVHAKWVFSRLEPREFFAFK
uniref:Secreted protein n=1 Tax=Trichogramma kaykai TaxID=54128 RepID=A0ABD2XMR8_9HYME